MMWTAECNGCRWKMRSTNKGKLKAQILAHKQASGHKVHLIGQLTAKEVERCRNSGRTYLAAVGQLL